MVNNILIINNGFLGDSLFAASLGENCKKNGYKRVDLVVGFPQTVSLLQNNPYLDNVYLSNKVGSSITQDDLPEEVNLEIYDKVFVTPFSRFDEKFLDTYNKDLNLLSLEYDLKFYLPEMEFEFGDSTKPRLAFQKDWHARSFSKDNSSRNVPYIIEKISEKYDVFVVGENTHYNINENTPYDFMIECGIIKQCDVFFGFPGGMHWIAAGVGIPTITTSEHMVNHYTNTGEFKGTSFEEFVNEWMLHADKHFNNKHILLQPEISDDDIIHYLLNYNTNDSKATY